MITRIWRGWTTEANADAYQHLLLTRIFPAIAARGIAGYRGIRLDRRAVNHEVEFVTTMLFDSMDDVVAFAGADFSTAVVPADARAVLERFDANAAHYELITGTGAFTPPPPANPR